MENKNRIGHGWKRIDWLKYLSKGNKNDDLYNLT